MGKTMEIGVDQLCVWSENPRHFVESLEVLEENEVINILIDVVGETKMYNLAKDIVEEKGLLGNVLPTIVEKNGKYLVYDGNRRVSCIKMLLNPCIIESSLLRKKITELLKEKNSTEFSVINAYLTNEEDAIRLMDKAHLGEQEGVGVIPWDSYQRDNSLVRREKQPQYKNAYSVSTLLGWKRKKDFIIPYTDLERLFSSKYLRDFFGINEFNKDSFTIVEEVVNQLIEYKNQKRFKSFSREFNHTDDKSDDEDKPIVIFCNWVRGKKIAKTLYIIHGKDVSIFEDEEYDDELLNIKIWDKKQNRFLISPQITITYKNPKEHNKSNIDCTALGKWTAEVLFKGVKASFEVRVKQKQSPKIEFYEDRFKVEHGNTIILKNLVNYAIDSHGEDMSRTLKVVAYSDCLIEDNVFSASNTPGKYDVAFKFNDLNKEVSVRKTITILRVELVRNYNVTDLSENLLNLDENCGFSISKVVNALVLEINQLNLEKFACVLTSSFRSVFELTFDELGRKKVLIFDEDSKKKYKSKSEERPKKISDLEYKFAMLKELLSNNEVMEKISKKLGKSFTNECKIVNLIEPKVLSDILHLSAHKSAQDIDLVNFKEKAKKVFSKILDYASVLINSEVTFQLTNDQSGVYTTDNTLKK